MSATNVIKQRLEDLKITQMELAHRLGMTKQNLNNKFSRDNFTTKELAQICNVLDLTLKLVDSESKEYVIEYKEGE